MTTIPLTPVIEEYKLHPSAGLLPRMTDLEFESLKADIRRNGQKEPITLLDGMILDGRHRYRACRELGLEPLFYDVETSDPNGYVLTHNLHRRHLTTGARALIGARLATRKRGVVGNGRSLEVSGGTSKVEDIAKKCQVGRSTLMRAKKIIEFNDENLIRRVEVGDISVDEAAKFALSKLENKTKSNSGSNVKRKVKKTVTCGAKSRSSENSDPLEAECAEKQSQLAAREFSDDGKRQVIRQLDELCKKFYAGTRDLETVWSDLLGLLQVIDP